MLAVSDLSLPCLLQSLPVVIFMNAVIAVGYHFGVVQAIIASLGRFLSLCLGTTPIESVTAAANIFLGMVSPLLDHWGGERQTDRQTAAANIFLGMVSPPPTA